MYKIQNYFIHMTKKLSLPINVRIRDRLQFILLSQSWSMFLFLFSLDLNLYSYVLPTTSTTVMIIFFIDRGPDKVCTLVDFDLSLSIFRWKMEREKKRRYQISFFPSHYV